MADKVTQCYFELRQLTREGSRNWQSPLVFFLSNMQSVLSKSKYSTRSNVLVLGNQSSPLKVPLKYFKILSSITKCDSLAQVSWDILEFPRDNTWF